MAKASGNGGNGGIDDSGYLNELRAMSEIIQSLSGNNTVHINSKELDKATDKMNILKKAKDELKEEISIKVDTKELTESQKLIQKLDKQSRSKYLVDEQNALRNLTLSYEAYTKAISKSEKERAQADVMRWGNAYKAAGYDTKKVKQEIFDIGKEYYDSFNEVSKKGTSSNQMWLYSEDSFKKLFEAKLAEGSVNYEENAKHWYKKFGNPAAELKRQAKEIAKEATNNPVELNIDDLIKIDETGLKERIDFIKNELDGLRQKFADKDKKQIDIGKGDAKKYVEYYSELLSYYDKIGKQLPQYYEQIFKKIQGNFDLGSGKKFDNGFYFRNHGSNKGAITTGEDRAQRNIIKAQKEAAKLDLSEYVKSIGKSETKSNEDSGEKIASGMKKAAEAAKEAKEEVKQVAEATKAVSDAEKMSESSQVGETSKAHHTAAIAAEEHSEKAKEAAESIREETKAQQELNAEKDKTKQENTQDSIVAQQAKRNEDALRGQADAQRELNDVEKNKPGSSNTHDNNIGEALPVSTIDNKAEQSSAESTAIEELKKRLQEEKRRLKELDKQYDELMVLFNEYGNKQGEYERFREAVINANKYGFVNDIDELWKQSTNHFGKNDIAKASTYYGLYRVAGGKNKFIDSGGNDLSKDFIDQYNSYIRLDRSGGINKQNPYVEKQRELSLAKTRQKQIISDIEKEIKSQEKVASKKTKENNNAEAFTTSKKDELAEYDQLLEVLDQERVKLEDIKKKQEINDQLLSNVRESTISKYSDNNKAIYDVGKLQHAQNALKEFDTNITKSNRNSFLDKYNQLIDIIQNDYLGDFGISNGLYKNIDDFISGNPALKQLSLFAKNGIKGVSSKELSNLFSSVVFNLKSEGNAVGTGASSGDLVITDIINKIEIEKEKLQQESQQLADEYEAQANIVGAAYQKYQEAVFNSGNNKQGLKENVAEEQMSNDIDKNNQQLEERLNILKEIKLIRDKKTGNYYTEDKRYELQKGSIGWNLNELDQRFGVYRYTGGSPRTLKEARETLFDIYNSNNQPVVEQHHEQEQAAESAASAEEHLEKVTESAAQAGTASGETTAQHQQQAESAEEAVTAEEKLKNATQDTANVGAETSATANAHKQQEESANAAADAEEKLKNATSESQQAGSQESGATHAHREQQKAAEEAAVAEDKLNRAIEDGARVIRETDRETDNGSYRTKTYELSKGLTRTESYRLEQQDDGSFQWAKQTSQDVANYNILLQDTIKYTQLLTTAEAALKLAQEKNSGKEVTGAIKEQINYYQQMIDKNRELAESYAKDSKIKVAEGTGGIPYTKSQYDTDVARTTKEIQLKIGKQSAEQIERQQARNEAELKKNQAEIDKANHYVTQQLQRLRDVENKYDVSVNAQASRGITGKQNLDQFKQQVKDIENFLNAMNGVKLDPSKMDAVTSMFGDLKRFGDNAYLGETAKKGDLSRQSVVSMKKVLSANIDTFQSRASLSNGDVSDVLRQAQELKDSLSTMFSGDEVSQGFTRLKELKAQLQSINEETKLVSNTSKEVSNVYQENINKIKALGEAHTQVNNIAAEQLTDKNSQLSMEQGLENVKTAAEEAKNALYEVYKMYKSGDISKEDFDKALQLYKSDETRNGSQNSRQKELLGIQKVVEELSQSYIKLADAKEKAEHSKTVSGREVGKIEQQRLKDRQEELKKRLERYNISEDYEPIATGKRLGELKTSEYEEKRNAVVNTKGLGFGEGDNIERTWDVLIQKASQYQQILFKQSSGGTLTVNEELTLQRLTPLYDAAAKQASAASEKYAELQEKMSGAKDIIYGQTISQYDNIVGNLEAPGKNMPQAYNDQVQQLRINLEIIKNTDIENPEWFTALDRLKQGINDLKADKFAMPVDEAAKASLNRRIADWVNKNSAGGEYLSQMQDLQAQLSSITSQGDLERIAQGFENVRASAAEAGRTGLSFGDGLIKRFKSLGQYLLSFASFYRIIGTLKQAINIVKELDSGLMEVRKVAKETDTTIKQWQKTTFNQADVVGGTASQIEKSTAAWLRLGKSFTESMQAAQASVKLLNVSEFTNIDDATTSLVSMRQAFQDLSYEDFIDKLNGVGDNFSSSTDQLAQGMQNVSAVLKVAGNDIDQSLALLTAANNITQDMSKASMGVRTVALRISGTKAAKEELEELGEDTSDFVVQTESKVDAQVRQLTATASNPNGVSVLDENGRLRDTYDILLDISKVYQEIIDKDNKYGTNSGNALLELLAGKTRSNILASILQAPDILEQAYETSKNSQGVGQRELDVYLDSIEARMQKLQNRLQELAFTTFDSEFIKTAVDGFTQLVNLATKLVSTLGALPTLLGTLGGFMAQKAGYGILPNKKGQGGWVAQYQNWFNKPVSTQTMTVSNYTPMSGQLRGMLTEIGGLGNTNAQLADAPIGPLLSSYGYDEDWINSLPDSDAIKEKLLSVTQDDVATVSEFSGELDKLCYSQQQVVVNTTGMSKAFQGVISVGKTLLSTVGTIATTMLVSFAIQGIIKLISNLVTMQQRAIDAGKKAQDSIASTAKSYHDQAESIGKLKDEYAELSEGVQFDKNGVRNIKLSEDEYSRFLDLSKQISEIAPELVSGYDNQGNAIVNLGTTVDGVNEKFQEYLDLQRDIAHAEIGSSLDKVWTGIINEADKYQNQLDSMDKVAQKSNDERAASIKAYKAGTDESALQNEVDNSTIALEVQIEDRDAIYDILQNTASGINTILGEDSSSGNGTSKFFVDLSQATESELESLNTYYKKAKATTNHEAKVAESQVKKTKLLIDNVYKQAIPSIQEYISTNSIFDQIGDNILADNIKNGLINMMNRIDYSSIVDDVEQKGGLENWLDNIIAMMSIDDEQTTAIFKNLFDLDKRRGNISYEKYKEQRDEYYQQLIDTFGEEYISYDQLAIMFGDATKDEDGNIKFEDDERIESAAQKVGLNNNQQFYDEIKNANWKYADAALSAIESLPREKANEIAGDWKAFWEYIEPYITGEIVVEKEPTNVLSDIFGDETYKENAEKYKSNLSTVTTALKNLKSEGVISPEDKMGLQELFPNLTDFSYEGISKAGIEQLSTWINDITSNWEDFTPEGIKQLDAYVKNLTLSYSDLAVSAGDARTAVFNALMNTDRYRGMSGYEKIDQAQSETDEKIQALKDEYGEDLNWNIVLALQDYFSGDAQTLIDKYGDYTLEWNIKLSNEEAEAQIENLTSERSVLDAQRQYEEAAGKAISKSYYEQDSQISRDLIEQYEKEIENADKEFEKSSKDAIATSTHNRVVNTLRQQIYSEMAHIEENDKNAETWEAGIYEDDLSKLKNDAEKAKQIIDDASNYGKEVTADQYQTMIDNAEKQIKDNQWLSNFYNDLAQQKLAEGDYAGFLENTSKANEFSAAIVDLNGNIVEWKNNIDSIDNTHLSNVFTQLQNEAEDLEHSLTDKTDGEKAVIYVNLQINAEAQKKNLEAQRQAIIDDFNKKQEENGVKYSFNDPEYQTYLENLRGVDNQLQSLADSQREWANALLNTPIDAINKKIDEYDAKLQEIQDRIKVREAKGGRKTAEDYDSEIELYNQEGITNTVKQGLLNAKAGILEFAGFSDLADEAKKEAQQAGSDAASSFADGYTAQREKTKLPLTEYDDELTALQQRANAVQRNITAAQEAGADVDASQFDLLISNADQQIAVQESIISYASEQLKGIDPTENIEDYLEFTAAIESAQDAIAQLESGQRDNQRSRIESIYGTPKLERELSNIQDNAHDLQNEITKAEAEYGVASDEQYNQLADLYEQEAGKQSALSRIYDVIANWYDLRGDATTAQEYRDKANDAADNATQKEADALEERLIPYRNEYNELQHESEQIQRDITKAEQKHQKVSKKTYQDLISNGKAQIRNMKQQQEAIGAVNEDWWDLQNSIDSMNDSIYDWSTTMDSLVYDQAAQLASTITTAISESMSETGLSTETINALLAGFSDLTGKDLDVSEAFYNTADGVKVNTEALRELTQAEFDLQAVNLQSEIDAVNDALDRNPGNSALEEKLKTLMQTQAQYFAQYEEMQGALSRYNAIDLAESTTNYGDHYDKTYDRLKTYKEASDNGDIGTDEFKAFTAYLDKYGRTTDEAFQEVYKKAERYLTEDAGVGLTNFMNDLEQLGYAEQDAEGAWTYRIEDMNEAAMKMGIGTEFFRDMFGKLQDKGGIFNVVESLTEAQLKTQDLQEQIKDATRAYADMYKAGATDEELAGQKEYISGLYDQLSGINTARDDYIKNQEDQRKKDFTEIQKNLEMYQTLYDEAKTSGDEELARSIRKMAQDEVSQFGYSIAEDKIALAEESAADYASRMQRSIDFSGVQQSIADTMTQLEQGGNVDLLARPLVDAAELVKAGWEDAGEGIATVFSSTYSNEDGTVAMNFTPIMTDENGNYKGALSPEELDSYAQDVISGVREDDLNLQIGAAFTGEDAIDQAVKNAEQIHQLQDEYYLGDFQQYYKENTEQANEYLSILSQVPKETLEKISLSNGAYEVDKDVEDAFQGLADVLGYTNENGWQLVELLGILSGSFSDIEVPEQTLEDMQQLQQFIDNASAQRSSGAGYQITTDYKGLSVDALNTQITDIGNLQATLDPNSDVYQQLEELKQNSLIELDIQTRLESGEFTPDEIRRLIANGGTEEEVATRLGIDISNPQGLAEVQRIMEMSDTGFDFAVHIDDTQFTQLIDAITDPWIMTIDADASEAEQAVEETRENAEKKPIIQTVIQKIQDFGASLFGGNKQPQQVESTATVDTSGVDKGVNKAGKEVASINKAKGTATVDVNTAPAMGRISELRAALLSLSAIRPMPIVDQSSIGNAISRVQTLINKLNEAAAKKNGLALGTAHTLGTAHSLGTTSLSRAYANGKDWTVGRDESALVNEIGQESRVRDGVWELIPGGPHVEDLKKDDIIFNAEQTADLIRTGKTARSGKLVAHANGTVGGMSAFASNGSWKNTTKKSSSKGNSGGNGGNGNGGKKNTKKSKNSNKQSAFEKWLEKLFDWIEVRLDRIQRKIDLFTAKAENAIGSLTKAGEAIIGSISSNKNKEVTNAMNKISTSPSQLNNVSIRTNSNGKVIGYTGRPTQNDLLGNSVLGAVRYQKQADKVASKALSSGVFKSKSRKSKSAQQKYMNDLINRIQTGRIDISEYSGDIKKFIDSYKEWYDKSQDLVQSTEELKKQYKELQQQKLDNITDEFETLVGLSEAVKSSSEATIDYFNTAGFAKNTLDREEIKKQQGRQNEITNYLYSEFQTYQKELQNAAKVFGTNSNEYHEAQTKLEEINKSLIESQKTERELSHELYNLGETVRDYFIDRVKSFIDKLGSTGSLAEKRGTNAVYGYKQTEDPYIEQTRYNNELILQYYERIKKAQKEIATQGDQINSDEYEKLYKTITDSESAITSLLSTNEDLKESIRTLRWKGYNDFQEKLNTIKSDLEHLQGFIRDGDILDDDAQFTDLGFAQIALIGEQMDAAEQKIRNAQGAITKLKEEYDNGVISLEKYNEELDAQIDIIQDASGSMFDYQQKLADMYIDQITAENDALQDLISARKDALSAKKEYYDWDKTLRNKNKDIAQLQAQINALQGVSNDAAQARRAKLQAELSEKQEDLNDTLYQHSIELQQEGYDKLSEDMQTALDNAVKLINGDQKVLQETANHMLNQLIASGLEQKDIISSIISDNATRVHDSTQTIIEKLEGEGGVEQLLSDINLSARTIGDAVNARALDGSVSNINTVLSIMQDSLGDDISGQLKAIEFAIGTLSSKEKEKEEQNRQQRKEVIEYQLSDINAQKTAIESNISSHSSSIDEKQAQIKTLENANDAINKNIANLYKSADNSFKQANTLQQQAQDLLKKADKAKKKADKKKYKKQAADKLNQAAAKKVQGNNYIKQYEKAVAAKPAQIKVNDNAISSLKEEIASLTNEMNGWENQVADLNKAISVLEEENFELSIPDLLTNGNTAKGITNVSGAYQTPKSLITGYGIINAGNESKSEEELAKEQISSYEDKIKSYEQLLSYLEEASDAHPEFMDDIAKYKANKQKLEEAVEELKNIYGFKKGTKNLPEDLLAWTNENWDKIGPEIIVRPQDNAILTPMKANDSVIPANLADNLFKWGAISPDKFITNPFVGKWDATGSGSSSITNDDSYLGGQTVEMHFDSLFHIEGNVDESVMPRLENLGKSLVNDRDFQKNVIKFVTKDFVRESKKQGIR